MPLTMFKISNFVPINFLRLLFFSFVYCHLNIALFHGVQPITLLYNHFQYNKTIYYG